MPPTWLVSPRRPSYKPGLLRLSWTGSEILPLASMTAFGRASGGDTQLAWAWEVRSVNGRSLEVRVRLPAGLDSLEPATRTAVKDRFRRGNVNCVLTVDKQPGTDSYTVNQALLEHVLGLQQQLGARVSQDPPRIEALLGLRGMVEVAEGALVDPEREGAVLATLGEALESVAAVRLEEGGRLAEVLGGQLERMGALTADAKAAAGAQVPFLKERLRSRVNELLESEASVSEERLVQELAVLATKADVTEELDRLDAHVEAARTLIEAGGTVGRRLDFLCQELNREANTLCSKSAEVTLTRVGLELKAVIEQLREQAQNLE